jgi:hypothetical protein
MNTHGKLPSPFAAVAGAIRLIDNAGIDAR